MAEAELNGYGNEEDVPDYRTSPGSNFGDFVGYFGSRGDGLPIPLANVPEEWRQPLSLLVLRSGIAALQEMLQSGEDYQEVWPADTVAAVSRGIYRNMNMVRAWKPIPKARIAAVVDAIRNRLLNFLLELKEQHPEVETDSANLRSIPESEVRVSVVNNIFGGTNIVASGGSLHQQVQQGVAQGDLDSLMEALRVAAVPQALLVELPEVLEEDERSRAGGIGSGVARWLGRVGEKATSNTVAALAVQAVLKYYGLGG